MLTGDAAVRLDWANRIAAALYARGAIRVWAFGSLGRTDRLDRRSDIDLAVEGLPAAAYAAVAVLARQAPCRVDLVDVAGATGSLRARWLATRRLIPRGMGDPSPFPSTAGAMAGSTVGGSRGHVPRTLAQRRLDAVVGVLRARGPQRLIDLGCGEGRLVEVVATGGIAAHVTGVDLDADVLDAGRRRMRHTLDRAGAARVGLVNGLITTADPRFAGHDTATAVEVIEHLPPSHLGAFASVLLGHIRPRTAVLTTPNVEYNAVWRMRPGQLRHPDHRFEWSRDEFARWCRAAADRYGYTVTTAPVGPVHPEYGPPTQLAVLAANDDGGAR